MALRCKQLPYEKLVITDVHLPNDSDDGRPDSNLYKVICRKGVIDTIDRMDGSSNPQNNEVLRQEMKIEKEAECCYISGEGGIVIPSLCHAHIHLDKCYLLDKEHNISSGTFQEALQVTSDAKSAFTMEDLLERGRKLVYESILYGVTAMRAHVEVDQIVHLKCLEAAIILKKEWQHVIDIQISVFAQDPFWAKDPTSSFEAENLQLLRQACQRNEVACVGSAPYVEPSSTLAKQNISQVISLAIEYDLHLDFHLDYNISPETQPLIFHVISEMRRRNWPTRKHVMIGHATRLSLFSREELEFLKKEIKDLPIAFVGLPQSDVYIMGRNDPVGPRGTLNVPRLVKEFGMNVTMAVNNVGNAFTPQGRPDPLSLCPFGVAVYQASTSEDCRILLDSVSRKAHNSIGLRSSANLRIEIGDPANLVILRGPNHWRLENVVLCPTESRITIKDGVMVANRSVVNETLSPF